MGHQIEEQAMLRQRWEQRARIIDAAKMRERREAREHVLKLTFSSLSPLFFVIGMSVWLAQRIMAQ